MATVNANPISDYDANFLRSSGADNWALVDEGMSRPNTADYTFLLDATSSKVSELFNFFALDNGENITSVKIRVYISRALASTIVYKFRIEEGANVYESPSNIIPPSGIFSEQNETLTTNPFTGLPWTFPELNSYGIGIIAVSGNVDIISLATIALEITTEAAGNKVIGDGLTNLI